MSNRHGLVPDAAARGLRDRLVPLARALGALGLTPNGVTVLGLLLTVGGAALLVAAGPFAALAPLVGGALADAVDGILARLSGRETVFGSFLDSTLDRVSDAAPFGAAALIAARDADAVLALVAVWALVASFLVSYARAKAESLGVAATVGVAPREARIVIVVLGIALWGVSSNAGFFTISIALTAILATVTVVQRVAHVARQRGTNP